MSGVQIQYINACDSEQRLDRYLRRQFPQLTQGRIEKMCRKGELRVEGKRVKSNSRLEAGQAVRIPPIPQERAEPQEVRAPRLNPDDVKMMQNAVIYKDDDILALNKPAGLATQGGSKTLRHIDGLSEALTFGLAERPRLVHRLDKDTSGVLLLARSRLAAQKLSDALKHRETRKIYWAAIAGVPQPRAGTIKYGLVKASGGRGNGNEKMRCIMPDDVRHTQDAKRAMSDYKVLDTLAPRASWCALVPVTGRTHQLRAHMAEIGHPIIGDGKYGGSKQENLGDGWGAGMGGDISRKMHLHARSLRFEHPFTGKTITITAPLPEHMQQTWNYVGWREKDAAVDPFEQL